jgi:tetratricopeptide (TPR) repeat protein
LRRLIEVHAEPEAMLNLGLSHSALGESKAAVRALQDVIEHADVPDELLTEAQYHLGRVLYVSDLDLDHAISLLQDATNRDPKLMGAYYYLGRALRDSARRNLLDLSITAFRKYLEGGAPLGRTDEVRRLIELCRNPSAASQAGRVSESTMKEPL